MKNPKQCASLSRLVEMHGVRWDANVPAPASAKMAQVSEVLTGQEKRDALFTALREG
jgi:hypothetical protein